jgi:hypothetical protein
MQVLFGILSVLIWTSLAFLNASLPTDADFCTTLFLHLLQAIATGSDKKSKKVDLGELFDWDVYLFRWTLGALLLVVLNRGTEVWVILHRTINEADAFVLQFLPITDLAGVSAPPVGIIRGWRRRRSRRDR